MYGSGRLFLFCAQTSHQLTLHLLLDIRLLCLVRVTLHTLRLERHFEFLLLEGFWLLLLLDLVQVFFFHLSFFYLVLAVGLLDPKRGFLLSFRVERLLGHFDELFLPLIDDGLGGVIICLGLFYDLVESTLESLGAGFVQQGVNSTLVTLDVDEKGRNVGTVLFLHDPSAVGHEDALHAEGMSAVQLDVLGWLYSAH